MRNKRLGQLETRLLAYAQMRGLRTARSGELAGPLRLSPLQERHLLSRMERAGWVARVRRGLYLLPPRLPLGGAWSPGELLALDMLVRDRGGAYQICGPNAFNRYGFDDQVPTRLYAYNDRISGDRTIGAAALTLIKVARARLGAVETVRTPEGVVAAYSSRTRSLVDAVYDWSRFDTLPRAYGWIERELSAGRVRAADLVSTALRYGNQSTIRRIGVLLEREQASPSLLRKLERGLNGSASVIAWVPNRSRRGALSRRWGVIVNG
jgi:predicted transcriptional regulator of viral defense system